MALIKYPDPFPRSLLLLILGLFLASVSVYFFAQGDTELSFYLLGCAIFISLFYTFILTVSIDAIQDDIGKESLSLIEENHKEMIKLLESIECLLWNLDRYKNN